MFGSNKLPGRKEVGLCVTSEGLQLDSTVADHWRLQTTHCIVTTGNDSRNTDTVQVLSLEVFHIREVIKVGETTIADSPEKPTRLPSKLSPDLPFLAF